MHGHVRPIEHVLAPDDPERAYAPDRSVGWSDAAATVRPRSRCSRPRSGPRRSGPRPTACSGRYADRVAEQWWAAAGFDRVGYYCLRPPEPLPGPLPGGVTARAAGPDDLDAVLALHREAVAFQAAASPYVRLLPAGEAGFRARLLNGTSTSTVLAVAGRVIAVCEWWTVEGGGEPDRPSLLPPGRYAYLNSVAVTADARSGGLGRAPGRGGAGRRRTRATGSTLWFSPPNPIASQVWPHLGWRPIWSAWERRS